MYSFVRAIVRLCLAVASVSGALANVTYEPLVAENGVRFLIVSGEFSPSDQVGAFVDAAQAHRATGVTFNSTGGNVNFAMQLGRAIRSMGLDTLQIRTAECASACALAFLGGINRYAEPGSIGVHQHSFSVGYEINRDDAVAAAQMVTADVLDYLSEMGVSSDLMKVALRYAPDDIRYLSGREMAEMRVTTIAGGGSSVATAQSPVVEPEPPNTAVPIPTWAPPVPAHTATPVVQVPATTPSQAAVVSFVRSVLEAHSENEFRAIQDVAKAYSPTVDYFGKPTGLPDVLADKLAYFKRWPERQYAIRSPTVVVLCQAVTCEVSGMMDWSVRSLKRNRQATGAAEFHYVVDTGNMLIVSENSRIIRE